MFLMQMLLLFMCSETNRSGDDWHWKEREFVTHSSQEKGVQYAMGWRWGHLRVGQETEGKMGTMDKSLYCGFLGKEQASQGRQI